MLYRRVETAAQNVSLLAIGAAVLMAFSAPELAARTNGDAQSEFVIEGDRAIGGYHFLRDGRLRAAIDAFGPPSSRHRNANYPEYCRVDWTTIGLQIRLYREGIKGKPNPCLPENGCFIDATLSDDRWRTSRGLSIGDSERKLRALYRPNHTSRRTWRWLLARQIGPTLSAKVVRGRITAFRVAAIGPGPAKC